MKEMQDTVLLARLVNACLWDFDAKFDAHCTLRTTSECSLYPVYVDLCLCSEEKYKNSQCFLPCAKSAKLALTRVCWSLIYF